MIHFPVGLPCSASCQTDVTDLDIQLFHIEMPIGIYWWFMSYMLQAAWKRQVHTEIRWPWHPNSPNSGIAKQPEVWMGFALIWILVSLQSSERDMNNKSKLDEEISLMNYSLDSQQIWRILGVASKLIGATEYQTGHTVQNEPETGKRFQTKM